MKNKALIVAVSMIIANLAFSSPANSASQEPSALSTSAENSEGAQERFKFTNPQGVTFEDALEFAERNQLEIEGLVSVVSYKDQAISIGVTGEVLGSKLQVTNEIKDQLQIFEQNIESQNGADSMAAKDFEDFETSNENKEIRFNFIDVVNPENLTVVDNSVTLVTQTKKTTKATKAAAAACGDWWPTLGTVYTGAVSANSRYGTMYFNFSAKALKALKCTGSSTFEPDFVTYNYDKKAYFTNNITSWSTSMPNAYLDTDFLDPSGENVITIGSHDNSTFQSGYGYYTSWKTTAGNHTSDTGKVVWQRGHYILLCPLAPAFCINPDDSKIVQAWNILIPGTFNP